MLFLNIDSKLINKYYIISIDPKLERIAKKKLPFNVDLKIQGQLKYISGLKSKLVLQIYQTFSYNPFIRKIYFFLQLIFFFGEKKTIIYIAKKNEKNPPLKFGA